MTSAVSVDATALSVETEYPPLEIEHGDSASRFKIKGIKGVVRDLTGLLRLDGESGKAGRICGVLHTTSGIVPVVNCSNQKLFNGLGSGIHDCVVVVEAANEDFSIELGVLV